MIVKCLAWAVLGCLMVYGIEVEQEITKAAGCFLNIKLNFNLPEPEPILLKPGGNNDGFSFYLPANNSSVIAVAAGEVVRIGCSGDNYFTPVGRGVREVNAICVSDWEFNVEGRHFDLRDLTCHADAEDTVRLSPSGEKCHNDSVIAEIGFQVRVDFIKIMDVCFDAATKNTLWTKYQLVAGIEGRQKDRTGQPNFLADNFYPGMSPDSLYSPDGQKATLTAILGSADLVDNYINKTGGFFLSRGHLVARADFVYFAQQIATYHYINVAPQWQTFNGGNWERIETSLRSFANSGILDLDVYTGTHGVTTLADVNGVERELWMYVDANNNKAVPVPKLYWKVAHEPKTGKAVALVGVNNPHVPSPWNDTSYTICINVCDDIKWLKLPTADNVTLGYSYCCNVDEEFRGEIKSLPVFNVTGLLTG